jgi:serine/threonine protein kinase
MPIVAGTRFGRYEIRERIGSGGMGDVYRAQDLTLDRPIAIKVLPPDVARVPGRMRRFVQEAKAVSALNHPNIITIHEISEGESGQFIAIEYVDGVTLRSRMRSGRLTLPEALEIAIQTAAALTAAHAAGIVHRDIKPENIMLRPDGLVKVLDFGLAKLTQRHGSDDSDRSALLMTREASVTEAGVVVGTALDMSPEQARGIPVDARTDIFSFGVVLYEMLAGRLPFDGTNAVEMMASMITGREPQPVSRYAPEVSPDVDRMVAKTLRTDPDARYQTMKDLLVDLRSIQQGTRTVAGAAQSSSETSSCDCVDRCRARARRLRRIHDDAAYARTGGNRFDCGPAVREPRTR